MPDQEVKVEPDNRDEKARQDFKQKMYDEATQTITEAVRLIELVHKKVPKERHPYVAMDIVNKVMDMFNCKTTVIHQPQIMPLNEAEMKRKEVEKQQQEETREQLKQQQEMRAKMAAEGQAPKTAGPVVERGNTAPEGEQLPLEPELKPEVIEATPSEE